MLRAAMQVEETITVSAEVAAAVADNDGRSFAVVVIFARWTGIRTVATRRASPSPFAGR